MTELKKILIVDDEEMVRDALEMAMERSGYQVTCAGNGQEAIEACDKQDFDIILSDIVMPEMDGVTLITTLRENGCKTPIISITGGARVGQKNMSARALEAGACEALRKPITKKDLLAAVERALSL